MHKTLALLLVPHLAHADAATGLPVYVEDKVTIDPRDDGTERYLTMGLLTRPTGGAFGLRAQLDVVGFAGFTLGAAGTLFGRASGTVDDVSMLKASAVGYLAYTTPLIRNLRLRAQLGYGAASHLDADMTTSTPRIVEGSLLLTARGNHDWSVIGGPIVQRTLGASAESSVMVFVGIQRRF